MPYTNTKTNTFGHNIYEVREAHPEASIPDGVDYGDFVWYAPTAPEFDPAAYRAIESQPSHVDGKLVQTWDVVPLTLDEVMSALEAARTAKNSEINAARLAANFSTFQHAGKVFACDQLSRSDIDGTNGYVALYGALPVGWPGGWKAVDNTYTAIADVAAWKAFYSGLFAAGNANFAHAQALKAQLASAQTIEDVEAIQW